MARRIAPWAVLALVALAGCGLPERGPERVVLVTIDTLRADRVGAYGDFAARTPVLDGLARRGVRFEEAFAPAPLTLPSHTSLMTGLEPPVHGVRHNSVFSVDEEIPLLAERMGDAGFATAAFVAAYVLDAHFGLDRGFDVYDDHLGPGRAAGNRFSYAERRGDAVVDAALDWLAEAPDRFFLWMHLFDPHADYDPPRRYLRAAAGDAYAGEIAFADAQVGRLLAGIEQRWGGEDLLVAVTSDHGESLGEHNQSTHSYGVYDATQHVPLLLAGADLPSGRVVERVVRLIDLAPTLLALAGAEPLPGIQGRSLLPLVRGGEDAHRRAYMETLATQLDMGWSPLLAVRTADHKYIRAPQPELYDLREDPGETHNLALQEPARTAALDRVLEEHLERARTVAPNVVPSAQDRARLESLGYVVPDADALAGRELGVVGGLNPRDHLVEADMLARAHWAIVEGRPRMALGMLERLRSRGATVYRARAHAALDADRPEQAVAALEHLRETGDATPRDLALLGRAHLAAGRAEDARRVLEAAREASPDSPHPHRALGRLAEALGDLAAAERHYLAAEREAAQPEDLRVDRAILRLLRGRTAEADALLEDVDAAFLADPPRALRLARAEWDAGRRDRSLSLLQRALQERPHHRRLLAQTAVRLEARGRSEQALEMWRRSHAVAPQSPLSRSDLARGLALAGRDLDRALELAREAARELEGDPDVLDTLAVVHLTRGEPEEALAAARAALSGAGRPLRPHLLYVRAAALAELDRVPEARDALRRLDGRPRPLDPPWDARAAALARRLDGVGREE